jgi:hypothetical protein
MWKMLSSIFTQIASGPDWLRLMDYLMIKFESCVSDGLLLLVPLVVLRSMKTSLLNVDKESHALVAVSEQQSLDVKGLIRDLEELMDVTPANKLGALITIRGDGSGGDARKKKLKKKGGNGHTHGHGHGRGKKGGNYSDSDSDSGSEEDNNELKSIRRANDDNSEGLSSSLMENKQCFPLPEAGKRHPGEIVTSTSAKAGTTYPILDNYPIHIFEMNAKTKAKGDNLEKELKRKKQVLDKLYAQSADVEAEHQRWMQSHSNRKDAENVNRIRLMEKEKAHMREVR